MSARPGKYRHRVTFQRRIDGRNPVNGAVEVWWETAHQDVPALVLTGPGRDRDSASTKLAETAARIEVRWFPGLEQSWRVLWLDKIYGITSIEMDETGVREYRLRCIGGLTDGQ